MPTYIFMEFKFKLKTIKIKKLHSTKHALLGVGYTYIASFTFPF